MRMQTREEVGRLGRGASAGVIATLVMTVVLVAGGALGQERTFYPFPVLLIRHLLGSGPSTATVTVLALLSHFAYGALAGLAFAFLATPMTVGRGFAYGLILWFAMEITFVPWLGWADLGLWRNVWFAPYTLVLHLVYGGTLGWFGHRYEVAHHTHFDELGRVRVR
jgi:uncharacterized protein DUF6789